MLTTLTEDNRTEAPLVNFVGRSVERNLTLFLEVCTPRTGPSSPEDEWILLREAARGTPYSQEYLSLLARKGRLLDTQSLMLYNELGAYR